MCGEQRRLPIELVDQIIKLAQYDVSTLKACAAVSHTWNALTLPYVFRKVRIRDEDALSRFEELASLKPAVGARVREITFGPFTPERSFRASTPWVAHTPRVLPRLLPNVRTIRFERLSDAAEYCDAQFFRQFCTFASVHRLVLYDSALNLPTLRAFACSLPRLDELVIVGMRSLMVNVWHAPPLVTLPGFTALTVDFAITPSTSLNEFIKWFQDSDAIYTLTSLDIAVKILDAKAVNQLFARVGPQLSHLGLTLQSIFDSDWEYEKIQHEIDISVCTNLQSLTLTEPCLPSTIDFLSDVPATSLETVAFRIRFRNESSLASTSAFGQLPRILESSTYNHLTRVRFLQAGPVPLRTVEDAVRAAFPVLHSRGVLEVEEEKEVLLQEPNLV